VASDVPADVVTTVDAMWISACALAVGTTADACFKWLEQRNRAHSTLLDLDYRPTLWQSEEHARIAAQRAIALSTVVVGNREECRVALGVSDPHDAAAALLDSGVQLAIVKMGGDGVLLATADEQQVVPPLSIAVRCGLGAGDAFGGALVSALIDGLSLADTGALANAAGALVATRLMCSDAMPDRNELKAFIAELEGTSPA
jgi:5-dehydro-2-deoxygluconokinase